MRLTARASRWVPRLGGAALLAMVLVLAGGSAALVLKAPWQGRPPAPAANRGCQVKQVALRDAQGRMHTTEEWRGCKGVVLYFLEPDCPVVNGYAPEMRRLADGYGAAGSSSTGSTTRGVSAEAAARHAAEHDLNFPILLDPDASRGGRGRGPADARGGSARP